MTCLIRKEHVETKFCIMKILKLLKNTLTSILAIIMLIACEKDVESLSYNEYDANNDGEVTRDEFVQAMDEVDYFEDINDDKIYNQEDLYVGYYNLWDLDNDGYVDEEEWKKGTELYFDDDDINSIGPYESWDMDRDLRLDEEEFSQGLAKDDYFYGWNIDEDSGITEKEFYRMVFDYWDFNGDGIFSRSEYEKIYNSET